MQYRTETQNRTDELVTTLRDVVRAYQTEDEVPQRFAAIETIIGERSQTLLDECEAHLAYTGNNYFPLLQDFYKSQQQQQQPSPGPFSQPLKEKLPILPLTLQERRLRLRSLGYTEQQLRKAERKRRIELSLQWASGQFPKQMDYPYSQRYFLNYVL